MEGTRGKKSVEKVLLIWRGGLGSRWEDHLLKDLLVKDIGEKPELGTADGMIQPMKTSGPSCERKSAKDLGDTQRKIISKGYEDWIWRPSLRD